MSASYANDHRLLSRHLIFRVVHSESERGSLSCWRLLTRDSRRLAARCLSSTIGLPIFWTPDVNEGAHSLRDGGMSYAQLVNAQEINVLKGYKVSLNYTQYLYT
ncbi:hypothetical protein Hypma_013415 [Hypsizygus marmoreus]|uniref:Uncharacterized protein n=1 Tax=Hypsizygus marmoreus TaxID=39966 RepID=A0A369JJD5_HYPMA|nr:hypothetical protein Hypma_013415 [Hypsizygus marmoreus]